MQNMKIEQNFFVFQLGGLNVVLEMEWLSSLGEIRANFKELTLKNPMEGKYYILKGEFKSIIKAIDDEG